LRRTSAQIPRSPDRIVVTDRLELTALFTELGLADHPGYEPLKSLIDF
jgi:hypothetical protein